MNRRSLFCLFASLTACSFTPLLAEEKEGSPVFTDPTKVTDPDFKVQGEYLGTIESGKWSLQVVALGDGKFDFVAYEGGLPGAGWNNKKQRRMKGGGQTEKDGKTILKSNPDNGSQVVIENGNMTLMAPGADKPFGELKRIERKSPTLGKKSPEGATVLFDGTNTDAWKGKPGKDLLDGDLLVQGVTSKETFKDFHLHLEFRTPYKPKARGQGRGNSGFYAQGRYEVQILDSFGLEGEENECGGIYSVGKPSLNLCLPPLTWQTYDVDFKAARFDESGKKTSDARISVRHNGVLIHENVVADHSTTASPLKEGPENGPVFFQDHGNSVRFRNVWLLKK
ncbi:DUF1080 domain-containing protein [bacterium]|nr:DUF1080 domain-containing protein [bacterium]